jgi:hypothetical protein
VSNQRTPSQHTQERYTRRTLPPCSYLIPPTHLILRYHPPHRFAPSAHSFSTSPKATSPVHKNTPVSLFPSHPIPFPPYPTFSPPTHSTLSPFSLPTPQVRTICALLLNVAKSDIPSPQEDISLTLALSSHPFPTSHHLSPTTHSPLYPPPFFTGPHHLCTASQRLKE